GLVDDERPGAVFERAGGEELILLDQARQVRPVRRPGGFHRRLVLQVLDHRGVLHGRSSVSRASTATATRSAGKYARLSTACAANNTPVKNRSPERVPR